MAMNQICLLLLTYVFLNHPFNPICIFTAPGYNLKPAVLTARFRINLQYPPALYNQMPNVVFVNYEHLILNQKREPPLQPKVVTKSS